jgi:thymidylate synthase
MRKADRVFKENLLAISNEHNETINSRPNYADGSSAESHYVTDVFEKYDLAKGEIPITLARKIPIKSAIQELLVIYQDKSNKLVDFEKRGITWWKPWEVKGTGTIGEVYGKTVANYDIIDNILHALVQKPHSRRHIINLWQYKDLEKPHGLVPCAYSMAFDVRYNKQTGRYLLDASLTMRSSDYLVAGHINMIQYVALQLMVAKHCGYDVGTFSRHTTNLHVYSNQVEQMSSVLLRLDADRVKNAKDGEVKFYLDVPDKTSFYDIKASDFKLTGYEPTTPQIKFPDLAI